MPSPNEITIAQASRLIGIPESPVFIDLRIDEDFDDDPRLIPSAYRHSFKDIESLVPLLKGQRVIVYCQKGKKISQGSAAILSNHGIQVETLEGGQFAWRDAGLPLVPYAKLPSKNSRNQTVWVTKHRPKIDRIACPWLIRRFIDPNALFLFVSPSEVLDVAEKFDATAFDVEGVFWSHRGDHCTFDTMIEEFELATEPLKKLSKIIRGADTNRPDLTDQSAGLLAASLGLSRMYRDDNTQLDAGMMLYDMLYRWARDATNESHDWPTQTTKN